MSISTSFKILGIDPGLANTGWSVIEVSAGPRFKALEFGTIKTKKDESLIKRITHIADNLIEIARTYKVDFASAEDIFFTNNITSGIQVAKVIGSVCYALLKELEIEVKLFTPTQIKSCISGAGNGDKKQVIKTVLVQVDCDKKIKTDHEADSIAAAVTLFYFMRSEAILNSAK